MDFPVSIPWETLDPEILQKAINSGSNYRTYCDEKSWDISFEIEFLEKEEIIFLLLVEHGRRKGGTSVQKTNERTEISKYTKEEQAKMVNAFNQSFNRFLIISLDVLICRYSPLFRAFPALFISEEPHKSFYYPSCFRSQK